MLHSLLLSTNNTRFLPDGSGCFLRSDAILGPTAEDIAFLRDHNVKNVIDLRSDREIRTLPCSLSGMSCFSYFPVPVSGGQKLSFTVNDIVEDYMIMAENALQVLYELENRRIPTVYFCHSGKDRTGVVSALLLLHKGMDEKTIIEDYLLSWEEEFDELSILSFRQRIIEEFLHRIHRI